jgi:hypothetical protein
MSTFSSRIIKGGALLADSRRLLEAWDPSESPEANLDRIESIGALGKTRMRQGEILEVFRRRFADPGPEVPRTLRELMNDPRAFREACYYEAARADPLLATFAEEVLFAWYEEGHGEVRLDDVLEWFAADKRVPPWNDETRARVAQGLLSAVRDFGVMEGSSRGRRKRMAPPHLTLRGFAYVALRERGQQPSDRALLEARVWRRYLLGPEAVRRLFHEADRSKVLRFAEAGSVIRIDWLIKALEEVPRVLAA